MVSPYLKNTTSTTSGAGGADMKWIYGRESGSNLTPTSSLGKYIYMFEANSTLRFVKYNIATMMIRARANSQRSYEIYTFSTDETMDYEFVKEMFKTDPQVIVNSIREQGNKIYSDYKSNTKKVIA